MADKDLSRDNGPAPHSRSSTVDIEAVKEKEWQKKGGRPTIPIVLEQAGHSDACGLANVDVSRGSELKGFAPYMYSSSFGTAKPTISASGPRAGDDTTNAQSAANASSHKADSGGSELVSREQTGKAELDAQRRSTPSETRLSSARPESPSRKPSALFPVRSFHAALLPKATPVLHKVARKTANSPVTAQASAPLGGSTTFSPIVGGTRLSGPANGQARPDKLSLGGSNASKGLQANGVPATRVEQAHEVQPSGSHSAPSAWMAKQSSQLKATSASASSSPVTVSSIPKSKQAQPDRLTPDVPAAVSPAHIAQGVSTTPKVSETKSSRTSPALPPLRQPRRSMSHLAILANAARPGSNSPSTSPAVVPSGLLSARNSPSASSSSGSTNRADPLDLLRTSTPHARTPETTAKPSAPRQRRWHTGEQTTPTSSRPSYTGRDAAVAIPVTVASNKRAARPSSDARPAKRIKTSGTAQDPSSQLQAGGDQHAAGQPKAQGSGSVAQPRSTPVTRPPAVAPRGNSAFSVASRADKQISTSTPTSNEVQFADSASRSQHIQRRSQESQTPTYSSAPVALPARTSPAELSFRLERIETNNRIQQLHGGQRFSTVPPTEARLRVCLVHRPRSVEKVSRCTRVRSPRLRLKQMQLAPARTVSTFETRITLTGHKLDHPVLCSWSDSLLAALDGDSLYLKFELDQLRNKQGQRWPVESPDAVGTLWQFWTLRSQDAWQVPEAINATIKLVNARDSNGYKGNWLLELEGKIVRPFMPSPPAPLASGAASRGSSVPALTAPTEATIEAKAQPAPAVKAVGSIVSTTSVDKPSTSVEGHRSVTDVANASRSATDAGSKKVLEVPPKPLSPQTTPTQSNRSFLGADRLDKTQSIPVTTLPKVCDPPSAGNAVVPADDAERTDDHSSDIEVVEIPKSSIRDKRKSMASMSTSSPHISELRGQAVPTEVNLKSFSSRPRSTDPPSKVSPTSEHAPPTQSLAASRRASEALTPKHATSTPAKSLSPVPNAPPGSRVSDVTEVRRTGSAGLLNQSHPKVVGGNPASLTSDVQARAAGMDSTTVTRNEGDAPQTERLTVSKAPGRESLVPLDFPTPPSDIPPSEVFDGTDVADAVAQSGISTNKSGTEHREGQKRKAPPGPLMQGRRDKWTEWSTRVQPNTLADVLPRLDTLYDGGEWRHVMRSQEEVSGTGSTRSEGSADDSHIYGHGLM